MTRANEGVSLNRWITRSEAGLSRRVAGNDPDDQEIGLPDHGCDARTPGPISRANVASSGEMSSSSLAVLFGKEQVLDRQLEH